MFKPGTIFSQYISPLLSGNSRTWIIGFIGDGSTIETIDDILEMLSRYNQLYNRAKNIAVPIVKITGIEKEELGLIRFESMEKSVQSFEIRSQGEIVNVFYLGI